jgi:NadR type nicotinamide-nucleotide adenylyltransferase
MVSIQKIVLIGPESTGKSVLSAALAEYFHTEWCPEYARQYLLQHGFPYTYNDLYVIGKKQLELEDKYTSALIKQTTSVYNNQKLLFIDTDMYVMKVWCEYVFNKCHQFILNEIAQRSYNLYLLCNTDLPWVQDELREYPDEKTRKELFYMYKDILINQSVPWVEISGQNHERIEQAVSVVKHFFKIAF